MANDVAIEAIDDPGQVRMKLLASGRDVHAPLTALDTFYQPLDADLTSWAAVVRAAGYDTFATTPSSANFAALLTDESGTGAVVFEAQGTFTPAFVATGATLSHATQTGRYTRNGRLVEFDITLTLNTSGNTLSANALTITGLPFTPAGGTPIFLVRFGATTTSYVLMYARLNGTTTLVLEGLTAANTAGVAILCNGALHATNGSNMRITGVYEI